ncbi:hypothetical protein [Paenibacillus wynnii]|uniref:hypothetical protein n=1 Tax=Paenibacillus wynnii TaxID=268407 RepID=UPI0027929EC6|nr:hypothetical protein [Paenibacillus wynnii]MDQ0195505.1 hypothetical protein [Paenibacillus wynnii]
MSYQRGHLLKRNYLFAFLILLVGFGGLLGYDLYFKPYVLSQTVVKVKVEEGKILPKNYELQGSDLYLDTVQTKDIPYAVITEISQVEHKVTNVNLTNGSILTEALIDVNELEPTRDEGVFPIPKEAIYGINGSLRSRDQVDIYLVKEEKQKNNTQGEVDPPVSRDSVPLNQPGQQAFLTGVTVNYVRTEDNNDVLDTEHGNNNNRLTSTGKVASPELKLKKSEGERLKGYLEQGFKLWIVRVE